MGEVAAGGEVESHDAVVRLQQTRVHGEVGGRATASYSGGRKNKNILSERALIEKITSYISS